MGDSISMGEARVNITTMKKAELVDALAAAMLHESERERKEQLGMIARAFEPRE